MDCMEASASSSSLQVKVDDEDAESMECESEFGMDSPSRNSEEEEERGDVLGHMGLTSDQLKEIEEKKRSNPGMFVSAWEDDDTGVAEKNLNDPGEQFLTAAENGDLDTVRRMIALDEKFLSVRDSDGYTALHRAAYNNHVNLVVFLLSSGADPEARTDEGWTVLHSAANWANYEVVGKLISHGVNVNALSKGRLAPLHLAICSQEDSENVFHTVRYLLEAPGIDGGIVNGAGDTPLNIARRVSGRIHGLLSNFLEKI